MALILCTGCGKQISDAAPSCIHCGMPRGGVYAPSGAGPVASSGTSPWMIVLIVVGGGMAFVFIVGILAAIAIPKFANVSKAAKEAEAPPYLRQVVALEKAYHATSGVYTSDLSRLEGWTAPTLRYYDLAVSQASDSRLCVDATPKPSAAAEQLESQSIDQDGWLYGAAGCVEPDDEAAGDSTGAAADSGEAPSTGLRPIERDTTAPPATGKPPKP